MCIGGVSAPLDDIRSIILESINEPCVTFQSHLGVQIPEELIGYYSDEQIQLTRKNQQTVDTSRLPALHEVDLGQRRELSEDAGHHLYITYMMAAGCAGVVMPESVGKFSDSIHRIYHFTPDGLSFDIVDRTTQSDVITYDDDVRGLTTTVNEPANPQLVLTSWNMFQLSSIESSTKFNTEASGLYPNNDTLYDAALFENDHVHVLGLYSDGANIRLQTNNIINHGTTSAGDFLVFPDDNSFSARLFISDEYILVTKGPRWAVLRDDFSVLKSGVISRPIWDAIPFDFTGQPGWVVVSGGSTTNLTDGPLAGGALGFIGITGYRELRAYVGAPTALYKDGSSFYVGVSLNASDIQWDLFNSSFRLVESKQFATTLTNPSFGNFLAHNGTLYGYLVESHGGGTFSPQLVDLQNDSTISFTTKTFTAPANFTPHTRFHFAETLVVDMRTAQTGGQVNQVLYRSCAALPPDDADYIANNRYWVMQYDNSFELEALEASDTAAYALGGGGVVAGKLYLQSSGTSFRFTLIAECNPVIPFVELLRVHTYKEYPTPFQFRQTTGSNYTYHKDGVSYVFPALGSSYIEIPVDVIDRNEELYLVTQYTRVSLANTAGAWCYRMVASTSTGTTSLENVVSSDFSALTSLLELKTINSESQYVSIIGQQFNAEPTVCDDIFSADRSWTDRRYYTKRFSTLDAGVVVRIPASARYVEHYLPFIESTAIEWNIDLSSDNFTITAPRYDRPSQGEYLFRAAGTSDYLGFFDHLTQGQVDVLAFSSLFITAQNSSVATFNEGLSRIYSGTVESVTTDNSSATINFVGMLEKLTGQVKDTTSVTCPYLFGGAQCGVALNKTVGVVTGSNRLNIFRVEMESPLPLATEQYVQGTLRFLSDGCQDIELDVRRVISVGGNTYTVICYSSLSALAPLGTQVVLANGCEKTMAACVSYNNLPRGRMLPYLQGQRTFTASGQIADGIP